MALWKPSLPMSIYYVRLTSVRVKDKARIYNNLRLVSGIGLHRRHRAALQGEDGTIPRSRDQ
jgi:hypothetical protein